MIHTWAKQWRHDKWDTKKVSASENTDDTTSELVLLWVQMVKAQRGKEEVLDNIKETKHHYSIGQNIQNMTVWSIWSELKAVITAKQVPHRDSALPTANFLVDVARPTTLEQCADWHIGSRRPEITKVWQIGPWGQVWLKALYIREWTTWRKLRCAKYQIP